MFLYYPKIDIRHYSLRQPFIMIVSLCYRQVLTYILLFFYQTIQLLAELLMNDLVHFLLSVF